MKRRLPTFSSVTEQWGLTFVSGEVLGSLEARLTRPTLILGILATLCLTLLALRAGELTLILGEKQRSLADGNRIRAQAEPAPRGEITTSDGVVIARNIADWRILVTPADLPKSDQGRRDVASLLAHLTGGDVGSLEVKLRALEGGYQPALLSHGLTQEQAIGIRARYADLPGIRVEAAPVREYPYGELYAHLLGYTGRIDEHELRAVDPVRYSSGDQIGKTGLEAKYEDLLHGGDGARQIEVDSAGRPVRELSGIAPATGATLRLTIDHHLQTQMALSLATMMKQTKATGAVGVALNPKTGAVLGYVSLPSYDPTPFSQGITESAYRTLLSDPGHPLLDRVIDGIYPPGSTIKPYIGAVALDAGTITPQTTINGPKSITVAGASFPDWREQGPGINLQRAIAVSSDVYFYGVGGGFDIPGVGSIRGLGIDRLSAGLSKFAFGKPTGVDLPGESSGIIPTAEWKERVKGEAWFLGDTYHASIGQGFLSVTPLQLAASLAVIAGGGTVYRPYIVSEELTPGGGVHETAPKSQKTAVFPPAVLDQIRAGMRESVTAGSSRPLNDLPVEVSGKTGTAEYGIDNSRTHAWFEGYAPSSDPTIALVVMVEGGGESFDVAVPVAREILAAYFKRP